MVKQSKKFVWIFFFFIALFSSVVNANGASLSGVIKIDRIASLENSVVCLNPKKDFKIEYPKINPMVDQRKLEFIPHILAIPVGSTVDFLNNDEAKHNIFTPDALADKFDFGYYSPGEIKQYTFKKPGVISLLCNKHDEMEAYVYVCESHLFTKLDKNGNFQIDNIPPGDYEMKIWNKKKRKKYSEIITIVEGLNKVKLNVEQ